MFFCVLLSFTKNWWSAFSSISRRRRRGETFIFDLLSLRLITKQQRRLLKLPNYNLLKLIEKV